MALAPEPIHPRDWSLSAHLRNDLRHSPGSFVLVDRRGAYTRWRLTGEWKRRDRWLFGARLLVREVRLRTPWPPADPTAVEWTREYRWRWMTPADMPLPRYGQERGFPGFGEEPRREGDHG